MYTVNGSLEELAKLDEPTPAGGGVPLYQVRLFIRVVFRRARCNRYFCFTARTYGGTGRVLCSGVQVQ